MEKVDSRSSAAKSTPDSERTIGTEATLQNLERVVARLAAQLNRLERLTILPNYKLPSKSALATLDDLPEDLTGVRILVKADVDIPGKLGSVTNHFKFERAAKTLNEITKRGGSALLLWGQGLTSVELLELSESYGSEWHEGKLRQYLNKDIEIRRLESMTQLDDMARTSDPRCAITFLPNLVDISPEDILLVKGSRNASRQLEGRAEEFCVQSRLVSSLANHYEIFVMDDFRSTVFQLPSNVGLAYGKRRVIGRGLEGDLTSLEGLVERCIYLGRRSTSQRIFVCGSSRPDDLLVVETFLQSRLFDLCLLGPYPSLVIRAAMGQSLSPSVLGELAQLSALNGRPLDALLEGAARRLISEYSDRIILPTDFILRHGGPDGAVGYAGVNDGQLASVGEDDRISAIGPDTVADFCKRIDESDLVFHFGMLGRGSQPEREQTATVIRRYCESGAEAFMAGDHILAIAHDMGLGARLSGSVTGAQTTSYYMTGVQLPGLVPFLKRQLGSPEG
jgi:3-phosphoglycerate kinase